jgi:inosine/xanthosine triphosphate pyrophosphatase family protein
MLLDNYITEESEEPHDNFMDNAIYKAKYYAKYTNEATLSEDSGLCIEAIKQIADILNAMGSGFDLFSGLDPYLSIM